MLIIKENTKTHAKLEGILNEHVEESRSNRLHMLQVIKIKENNRIHGGDKKQAVVVIATNASRS